MDDAAAAAVVVQSQNHRTTTPYGSDAFGLQTHAWNTFFVEMHTLLNWPLAANIHPFEHMLLHQLDNFQSARAQAHTPRHFIYVVYSTFPRIFLSVSNEKKAAFNAAFVQFACPFIMFTFFTSSVYRYCRLLFKWWPPLIAFEFQVKSSFVDESKMKIRRNVPLRVSRFQE